MRRLKPRPAVVRVSTSSSQDDRLWLGFEELSLPLFDSIYKFARWLVGNRSDAEDLVQETYLKALQGFASFQPDTNFRAWIFRILRNTFLSSRSKLERRMTVAMDSDEDFLALSTTSDTPESLLIDNSAVDAIRWAIAQLPPIFREVIFLCDVEDASYREIAEKLSIPIGTVMSRLARARKGVRDRLRSSPGAPPSEETFFLCVALRRALLEPGVALSDVGATSKSKSRTELRTSPTILGANTNV